MKKLTLLITALAILSGIARAQTPDTAKLIVHYKFTHLRDTTQKDKPYTENMVLFIGQQASAYKSYDRKMQEASMRKQMAEQLAAQKGSGRVNISVKSSGGPTTSTEYYQFAATGKLVRKERLFTPYLIEEAMPVISWKISADTMTIGGMHCQKATAHFKGRDYTAWFCPDLPFHSGPWKLNGLPGLILEAYDARKDVVFKFDSMEEAVPTPKATEAPAEPGTPVVKMVGIGMEDANADPNVIAVPTDAVKTTDKEFAHLQEAMRKDPNAFLQSSMAGSGANFKPGQGPSQNIKIMRSPDVTNNPLELPEKK